MALSTDGLFFYAEGGLNNLDPPNQLEADPLSYDERLPLILPMTTTGSGVGDISASIDIDTVLSNGGDALTMAGGALVLTREFKQYT